MSRKLEHTLAVLAVLCFVLAAVCFVLADRSDAYPGSPGYVTYAEWRDVERGTMSQTERDWEVTGAGHVVSAQQHGQFVLKQYPGTDANHFAQVFYARNAAGQYVAQYASWWVL